MADPKEYLTTNVVKDIFEINDKDICLSRYPYLKLQVLKLRVITVKEGEKAKVRFTLSDGTYTVQGVYTHSTPDADNAASQLSIGTVLKITNYEAFVMPPGKPVLLFETWEVASPVMGKLGSPAVLKISENPPEQKVKPDPEPMQKQSTDNGSIIPQEETKSAPKPASKLANSEKTGSKGVTPIEYLSPYANSWKIRGRVTMKGDIREFTSQRGIPGKLFNFHMLDETSEIRVTGFTEAADKWYDFVQEGKVYYLSKASVVLANKRFSALPNEYEIRLERDTSIELCDDPVEVPQMKYSFVALNDLSSKDASSNVDVIGAIKSIDDVQEITSKAGKSFEKREIHIVDKSKYGVNVALWGKTAKTFTGSPGQIVALKGARVNDFNGKSLSVGASTNLNFDPDIPEAHEIKGWFDSGGKDESFNTFKSTGGDGGALKNQECITIAKAKDDNLGQSEAGEYFNIKGTVTYIKSSSLTYPACTTDGCRKKVIEETNGEYRCEKCNITISQPNYLYIFSPVVEDHTDRFFLNCFNETCEVILGIKANDLLAEQSEDKVNEVISKALGYEYLFRVRARQDSYNDQTGVRYSAVSIARPDYVAESNKLIELINKF
ncbi:hypothetical protein TRICI_002577 [Trichomonascus ciferrii]|uniref:Replication protein A subunit n=1 Tax=Trichomonascus ciferrii TaxID=44093 RepID=A0A642V5E8_9ASCO|nr:hypothetical protein TRICI_002577 [Trichomonascus ciferrii]